MKRKPPMVVFCARQVSVAVLYQTELGRLRVLHQNQGPCTPIVLAVARCNEDTVRALHTCDCHGRAILEMGELPVELVRRAPATGRA